MKLVDLVLGRRPAPPQPPPPETIDRPPAGVWWREVRPRQNGGVRAAKATRDGVLATERGDQRYRAGQHYLVKHTNGDEFVVRADVFEATYRPMGDGRFAKRTDIVLRYFTLDRPVTVRTLEGPERAEAGDWIMEGVLGELWPIDATKARGLYAHL
jgi:hypothetical protein